MADVEITQDEVRGIDINQVASMQLKDGTIVMVSSGEEQCDNQGEYQEELPQEQNECYDYCEEENVQDQSNQLRARPVQYVAVPPRVGVVPGVMVAPKPVLPVHHPPKPMGPHRGPHVHRPMPVGPGVVFRARKGYPMGPVVPVAPKPHLVHPGVKPVPGPVMRPLVKPVPAPGMRPLVQPVVPGPKPMPSTMQKPLVSQMIQAPRFRARPVAQDEEFQEEEYAGEEDFQCNVE